MLQGIQFMMAKLESVLQDRWKPSVSLLPSSNCLLDEKDRSKVKIFMVYHPL